MKAFSVAALSCVLFCHSTLAQAPSAPTPQTEADFRGALVGFMHAIHATNNVDTTAAFYKEVFGLSSPIRPFVSDGPRVLTNSPEANLRVSMLPIPGGFNFELTEFTNTPTRTLGQQPAISDPGAPHMKFLVRDIESVMAGVKKMGLPIITTSKAPVAVKTPFGDAKAIFFRDPDGYIVEAVQIPPPADAPAGNVIGSIMGVTVRDMDADMKFWSGRMGLDVRGDAKFANESNRLDLYGLGKNASYRTMSATFPASTARIEFVEFKGMPRKEFSIRVTDPGASGMAIRVKQIQTLLADMKKEGMRVLSKNEDLVEWSPTIRNVFVKDPNGLNLELVGTPAGVPAVPFPGTQPAPDRGRSTAQAKAAEGTTTQNTLLDRIQIEDLMIEYYWAFSTKEGHDIKKYWAEDGEFNVGSHVVKGWAAIEAEYRPPENADKGRPKFVMLLGNPRIRVTGDTAVMDAIFTGMTSTDPNKAPVPSEQGTDHVEFVKIDGQWKIKKRVLVTYAYVPRESLMEKQKK